MAYFSRQRTVGLNDDREEEVEEEEEKHQEVDRDEDEQGCVLRPVLGELSDHHVELRRA